MPADEPLIRDISDTARWAALYRARESERPDALFRDPFARRLAGTRGDEIARSQPFSEKATWSWVTRTVLFDRMIEEQIGQGADLVVNLAAGFDARPYRLELPRMLRWVEIDLPPLLAEKERLLAGEQPRCDLERIGLDLADIPARRDLFARLGHSAKRALIVSEGLLVYLSPQDVGSLARDLAAPASFRLWVNDLLSPGLLKMLRENLGAMVAAGGAEFQFGPEEGPAFFGPHGWRPRDVRSLLKTAARLKRLTLGMRLIAWLPESNGRQGSRPWSAVCLFERDQTVDAAAGAGK